MPAGTLVLPRNKFLRRRPLHRARLIALCVYPLLMPTGTLVFPRNKYLVLRMGQKEVLCEDVLESMVSKSGSCWASRSLGKPGSPGCLHVCLCAVTTANAAGFARPCTPVLSEGLARQCHQPTGGAAAATLPYLAPAAAPPHLPADRVQRGLVGRDC